MTNSTAITIIYSDPVVGQAIALLLQGIDYDVKFKDQSFLDNQEEILELLQGSQMIILAPGINVERREKLLALLRSDPDTASIHIIELGSPPEGARKRPDHYVPWPIRTEDLKRRIETTLTGQTARPYSQTPWENEEESL